jgi:hypothetical protein
MISPMIASTLIFLVLLTLFSAIGALLVNKFISKQSRHAHRMLMQPALTVAGMMFSILLGFFIAQALREYSTATADLTNEANAAGEVYRDAAGLPEIDRKRIRALCREYVDKVIDDEWQLMPSGKLSEKAQGAMNELWEAALSVNPTNGREEVVYNNFFRAMNDLGGYRRVRATTVTNRGIEGQLWIVIAAGAAAIVTLTFLFAPESRRFHAALLACLLIPMTLNIYLLSEYSYPLSPGMITIKPVMFESMRQKIFSQPDRAPHFLTDPMVTTPVSR